MIADLSFSVCLRYMILWLYWQYETRILAIVEAPAVHIVDRCYRICLTKGRGLDVCPGPWTSAEAPDIFAAMGLGLKTSKTRSFAGSCR